MLSRIPVVALAIVALVGVSAAVQSAGEGNRFVGVWKGRIETYDEVWTVKHSDGVYSINGKFRKNGADVGSFIGTDIKEADGTLSFTRKFIKKPANVSWQDQVSIAVKSEGENLSYVWSIGGQKGTRALEKFAEGADKTAEDDLGKFRGNWTADMTNGYRVVMQITMKKDKVDVSANFYKKGQLAGSYVGDDPVLKDGFLTFTQKWLKKPVSSWRDLIPHTLEMKSDNLLSYSWQGGRTENFTRVKK